MQQFITLPKLSEGDQVAVISPSSGLAGVFPWVEDLGIARLKSVFGLVPKEFPTTRVVDAPLEDRARDIMAAFSDAEVKAVFASIGGSDQIQLIKLLDPEVLKNNPKPFFGYSDNTHLHNFLWNLGIPSYYGGSVMTQLAMQHSMDQMTVESMKNALFDATAVKIHPSEIYNDVGLTWSDESNLTKKRVYEKNEGWFWDGNASARGRLWGGCVESLIVQFTAGKYLPGDTDLKDAILILETAEDIPDHWIIEYLLVGMGERGWLNLFSAVLVGRPKAWEYDKQLSPEEKRQYKIKQRETVLKTVRKYNQHIPVVQNMDFGHTDPQTIVPLGNVATVDSRDKSITFQY